tara:strand:- start:243 stop:902 length:660 start_codon:yes stop_codon:yes gene_type:complete
MNIILGIDEAGRGPLFGRVYTSCVVLPEKNENSTFNFDCLKDSKKFTSKKKLHDVADYIKEYCLFYSINYEDENTIDKVNILEATMISMNKSIINVIHQILKSELYSGYKVENIINSIQCKIDGNKFKPLQFVYQDNVYYINCQTIVKGDSIHKCISAASILAKDTRDNYIRELCVRYPELDHNYGLSSNMGYGTKKHIEGIKKYGYTDWHRKSFKLKN